MRKILVRVEEMHIRCGARSAPGKCPIALAITPLLPAGKRASVGPKWFNVIDTEANRDEGRHPLPSTAWDFVYRFDGGFKVEPFEFQVEV